MKSEALIEKKCRRITKDDYDNKLKTFKERQQIIVIEIEEHTKADESFYLTASQLLDVAKRASEIFESSEIEEKRQLLNFLLQNCQLDGRNLLFKMKTPFDTVLSCNSSSNWLHLSDSIKLLRLTYRILSTFQRGQIRFEGIRRGADRSLKSRAVSLMIAEAFRDCQLSCQATP